MCRVAWADLPGLTHRCTAKKFCWLPLRLGLGSFMYVVKERKIREQIDSVPHEMNVGFFTLTNFLSS